MTDKPPFPCHPITAIAARMEAEARALTAREAVLPDLRRILAAELGRAAEDIAPTATLAEDLAMDELDSITVALGIEHHFEITIEDDAVLACATVADLADVIARLVAAKAGEG